MNDWIWIKTNPKELRQLVNSGKSTKEIAQLYGVSYWSIYKKAKAWNIRIPKYYNPHNKDPQKCLIEKGKLTKKTRFHNKHVFCNKHGNPYYSSYYGVLTKDLLFGLARVFSPKEMCRVFNVSIGSLHKKAQDWRISLRKPTIPNWKIKLSKRVSKFRVRTYKFKKKKASKYINYRYRLQSAIHHFCSRGMKKENYSVEQVINYLGGVQCKCFLTGRDIDLTKDDYQLDHIIPVSRGGSNELSNMSVTIPSVNQMKHSLLNEELFELCVEILQHNGYTVTKIPSPKELDF